MMTPKEMATRSQELVQMIRPLLAGEGAPVQSAALADLVAIWLAGHQLEEGGKYVGGAELDALREAVLTEFINVVRALIPPNDAMIREQHKWKK